VVALVPWMRNPVHSSPMLWLDCPMQMMPAPNNVDYYKTVTVDIMNIIYCIRNIITNIKQSIDLMIIPVVFKSYDINGIKRKNQRVKRYRDPLSVLLCSITNYLSTLRLVRQTLIPVSYHQYHQNMN
jgi:hypothetical protein